MIKKTSIEWEERPKPPEYVGDDDESDSSLYDDSYDEIEPVPKKRKTKN